MAMAVDERLMSDEAALLALYEEKARAELTDADAVAGPCAGAWRGEVMAAVAVVVGIIAGEGGPSLVGEAGESAAKALAALGFEAGSVFVIASRSECDPGDAARADRLRLALEAVDPPLVMALDAAGAADLRAAFDLADLPLGQPVVASGRTFGYVGDFVASLGDDRAKAPVWKAMKAVAHASVAVTSARRQSAPREKSGTRSDKPKA